VIIRLTKIIYPAYNQSMKEQKKSPGRPVGKPYPVIKQVRLGTRDAKALGGLAAHWAVSESEVVRRLVTGEAAELGLPLDDDE